MSSNLDRYKTDLDALIKKGNKLQLAIQAECNRTELSKVLRKQYDEPKVQEILKDLPSFRDSYQSWYSESKAVIRQLLPDRLDDFVRHYEKPKGRKDITFENYKIDDYLQSLTVTRSRGAFTDTIAGPEAAIPQFFQQYSILKAVRQRFESSLFDIRQLVQADLFDSELEAAQELAKNKFTRAAGAIAGVVLEKHLGQVCQQHGTKIAKKLPTLSTFNDALKDAGVIEIPQWRFIQHLADLRNLCDHGRDEPTVEQVQDLIAGVSKVSKTLF